jgi:hypothetical protein
MYTAARQQLLTFSVSTGYMVTHISNLPCLTSRNRVFLRLFILVFVVFLIRPASAFVSGHKAMGNYPAPIVWKPDRNKRHPVLSTSDRQYRVLLRDLSTSNVELATRVDVDTSKGETVREEKIPKTVKDALRVFFFDAQHLGPPCVVASLLSIVAWRVNLSTPIGILDGFCFVAAIVFWWFQEHVMHDKLLHSKIDWYGRKVHEAHHKKPYFHISIDPAPLILGWLLCAHLTLSFLLPKPLALSATLGYAGAGLFYEWSHFIVHTKVRFRPGFWKHMKSHHIRHHCIDSRYWLGFSVPAIDDLFGTNPTVQQIRKQTLDQDGDQTRL